ncbi:MAG: helix-turn-helix domain-containing protein [Kiritimatiellia bacterium]
MSGHRNFNELLSKMTPERRSRIKAEADDLHRDYVLAQIRQQVGFTQSEVAQRLGVSQPTYAECERGSNMRIGTLQKIVSALGGELSLRVVIDGRDYNLQMPQLA